MQEHETPKTRGFRGVTAPKPRSAGAWVPGPRRNPRVGSATRPEPTRSCARAYGHTHPGHARTSVPVLARAHTNACQHARTHARTPARARSQVKLPDNDTRAMPDGPCEICDKDECYAEDMFVQCAACGLTVHQGCYG
jgi:hypothetical protein